MDPHLHTDTDSISTAPLPPPPLMAIVQPSVPPHLRRRHGPEAGKLPAVMQAPHLRQRHGPEAGKLPAVMQAPVPPHLRRRHGPEAGKPPVVCKFWKSPGGCTRRNCQFLHSGPAPMSRPPAAKKSNVWINPACAGRPPAPKRQKFHGDEVEPSRSPAKEPPMPSGPSKEKETPQREEPEAEPPRSSTCTDQQAWCVCDGLGPVARLGGHTKAVTGIALPDGRDRLCSSSKDGTLRMWDCVTGQCVRVCTVQEGAVEWLICRGEWLFIGFQKTIRAFHMGHNTELTLPGPRARFTALFSSHHETPFAKDDEFLFAGTEDGNIYVWKIAEDTISELAILEGHETAVASLTRGYLGLFSGSLDGSIRVWDLKTFRCTVVTAHHTSAVTSLLVCDNFLLSSRADGMLNVWAGRDADQIKVVHSYSEGEEILAMEGTHDAQKQPVLMVSCRNGTVRIHDLPSLQKRGQIHCQDEVTAVAFGPRDLVFIGEVSGEIKVARWLPAASPEAEEK